MSRSGAVGLIVCAAAAMALAAALPSRADRIELPTRKSGLWDLKLRVTGGGVPTMSMQQCTDPATDKDLRAIYSPLAKETCTKRVVTKTPSGYAVDRVCTSGGDTVTTHIDITGDDQSAYSAHLTSRTQDDQPNGPPSSDMTMDAKYLGPCRGDQQPGDIIMMGGMKINLKEIKKLHEQQRTDDRGKTTDDRD
jgi:Protein of unknown function (DUF3617)